VYSIYHLQKKPPYLLLFMWVVHTKWWENIKCILPCKHSVCKKYSHKFLSKFSYCFSNSKPHWILHKQITFCRIFSCLEKHNCKDHSISISCSLDLRVSKFARWISMNKRVYYHIAPLTVQILIVKQRCGENAHETTTPIAKFWSKYII
jgi:hypothetical protein